MFNGFENFMRLTKEYTVSWICQFDMFWYPFDTQTCSMEFYSHTAVILPNNLTYIGLRQFSAYDIPNVQMCSAIFNGRHGVKVKIGLGRRLIGNILTVFLPSLILITISHMANQFQINCIDLVISANLTVLLVLATL